MFKDDISLEQPVVQVKNLSIAYQIRSGEIRAVRDISFDIQKGEALGLVGKSGCGKSTVAYGLVGYLGKNGKVVGGDVMFQGKSMVGRSREELRSLRGNQISMVFQGSNDLSQSCITCGGTNDGGVDLPSPNCPREGA